MTWDRRDDKDDDRKARGGIDAGPRSARPATSVEEGPTYQAQCDARILQFLREPLPLTPSEREAKQDAAGGAATGVHAAAERGLAGAGTTLPHGDKIQAAFGPHDVSGIQAHVGGAAAEACGDMGASAYATGNQVAFAGQPNLHTAAHEAAHVVQQRQGVQLYGGVGQVGDVYERQADAVADAVVAGKSAAGLLGDSSHSGTNSNAIQCFSGLAIPQTKDAANTEGPTAGGATGANASGSGTSMASGKADTEDPETLARKTLRIAGLGEMYGTIFDMIQNGVHEATSHLAAKSKKADAFVMELVNMAAIAAVSGAAGVAAQLIADRYAGFKGLYSRFANDALKNHLKNSVSLGKFETVEDRDEEMASMFRRAQDEKITHSRMNFVNTFYRANADMLLALPLDVIEGLMEVERLHALKGDIQAASARRVSLEWANLIARTYHGAGGWDTWEGDNGSKGAVATSGAVPYDHSDPNGERHPSRGNVDQKSDSMQDILENDQWANGDAHGLLEIDLWQESGDEFTRYVAEGHGVRMGGVSDYIRRRIAEYPRIRDVRGNKVISLYNGATGLRPPPSYCRILVTPDGYIRKHSGRSEDMAHYVAAVEYAQALPASLLAK